MGKVGIVILSVIIVLGLAGGAPGADKKRVFIVASYEENHVCGGPQEEGIIKGLSREGWFEGMNLDVKRYYMDTKRKNTSAAQMKEQASRALAMVEAFEPHLIVTVDDNAFREVGLPFAGRSDMPVVFSGMNGQPETYDKRVEFMDRRDKPGNNITGVYEKLYLVRSIKVMISALGNRNQKKIVGITDFSPTGRAIAAQFKKEIGEQGADVTWELITVKDWNEYTAVIERINGDESVLAIYPVALTLKVSDGVTYTAPEIFKWTLENSRKPEMALNYFFSKVGLFGGAAVDFRSMGFTTGKKAGKILGGMKPGDLPIEDAPDYAIVFNLKRARMLGIEIPIPLLTAADFIFK